MTTRMDRRGYADGGSYRIMPYTNSGAGGPAQPRIPDPTLQPPTPTPAPGTKPDMSGLLEQSVFGIPVKWLLIGGAAFLLLRKK